MRRAALGLLLALLLPACGVLRPLATDLPPEARAEHLYLATLEDYRLFSADVNAYISQPSVSRAEAERIDAVMDRADAELRRVEALRASAASVGSDRYALAAQVLREAARTVCVSNPEVSASCEGR